MRRMIATNRVVVRKPDELFFLGFCAALFLRFFVILGVGNCSALAPDELSYISFASGKDHIVGLWTELNPVVGYLIFLPFRIFIHLGLSETYSIRFNSLFFWVLSSYFIWKMLKVGDNIKLRIDLLFALLGFLFLPSYVLWTTLGLRESFISFGIISFLYSITSTRSNLKISIFTSLASILFLISIKRYLAVILVTSAILGILLSIAFGKINRNWFKYSIIAILVPVAVFQTGFVFSYMAHQDNVVSGSPNSNSSQPKKIEIISTTAQYLHQCKLEGNIGFITGFLSRYLVKDLSANSVSSKILDRSSKNSITEDSSSFISKDGYFKGQPMEKPKLDEVQSKTKVIASESKTNLIITQSVSDYVQQNSVGKLAKLKSLPINVLKYLFSPNFFDLSNSISINFSIIEFPYWIVLYILTLIFFVKSKSYLLRTDLAIFLVALILFIFLSALTETNLGTIIRHRSILILLIITMFCRFSSMNLPTYDAPIKEN